MCDRSDTQVPMLPSDSSGAQPAAIIWLRTVRLVVYRWLGAPDMPLLYRR